MHDFFHYKGPVTKFNGKLSASKTVFHNTLHYVYCVLVVSLKFEATKIYAMQCSST